MNAAVLGEVVLVEADDGSTALRALKTASRGHPRHGNSTSNEEAVGWGIECSIMDDESSSRERGGRYDISSNREMVDSNRAEDDEEDGIMQTGKRDLDLDLEEGGSMLDMGFDLVFIDYVMTKMNGPEAVQIMRRDMKFTGGIIGVTGNALPSDLTYFKECGADLVITKPLTNKKLMDAVISVAQTKKNRMA